MEAHQIDDNGAGHQHYPNEVSSRDPQTMVIAISQPYSTEKTQYGDAIQKERKPTAKQPPRSLR